MKTANRALTTFRLDTFPCWECRVLLGRELGSQDTATSQMVCVVNEAFVKHFFAGKDPIGRHITKDSSDGHTAPVTAESVGVVKDSRVTSLRGDVPARAYMPVNQAFLGKMRGSVVYEIRTESEPLSVLSAARTAILGVNPDAPIETSLTLEEAISHKTRAEGQIARLCAVFGGLALLLAATGLYGGLFYGVTRRTNG